MSRPTDLFKVRGYIKSQSGLKPCHSIDARGSLNEPRRASQCEILNWLSGLPEIFIFSIRGRSNSAGRGEGAKAGC